MIRLLNHKLALFTLGLLILASPSCKPGDAGRGGSVRHSQVSKPIIVETEQPGPEAEKADKPQTEPAGREQGEEKSAEPPLIEAVNEPPNVVAKIGGYVITKQEVEERLMAELQPGDYEWENEEIQAVDAKTILLEMIAEKAMIMEARKQNLMERGTIRGPIKESEERKLVGMLLQGHLQDKINVSDSEIEERLKANPKLDRNRAKAMLEREQAGKLISQYYDELLTKYNGQKLRANFPKAAEIHQRLLLNPKEPRKMAFIRNSQVENELTEEEKNIVLAKYDDGEVTLKEWFDALCELSPPSRPRDMHKPEAIEQLLDRVLSKDIFVTEARRLGLDKDENFIRQIKQEEDTRLLSEVRNEKARDVNVPTDEEQILAYFNENKELFGTSRSVKIDQIWCQDLKTAQEVKTELDSGRDFESVKEQRSLEPKRKPFNSYPRNEGMFFEDLWKGEPNEIVGPIKGFYRDGFKWRVVKILEKKPGQLKEYSDNMKNNVKWRMESEQSNAALDRFKKELLEKYPYEIYADRIKDIDPLNIP